jgi:hypothetical protein
MSDPKYAPYGVDDDPFLTHPAGVGRAPLRGDNRFAQQPMVQRGGQTAPTRLPPAPVLAPAYPTYPSHDDAPQYGQGGRVAAQDPWAQHAPYDPPQPQHQPQYAPQPSPAQHSNFRARGAYRAPESAGLAAPQSQYHDYGHDDAPDYRPDYAPDYRPDYGPDYGADYARAHAQPAPHPRAEPRVTAPHPAAQPSYAAAPRAPFSAPPRAAQDLRNDSRTQPTQAAYGEPEYAPRSYAPLPQPPRYAGYDEGGFGAGLLPNPAKLMQVAGAVCTILALIGAGYWGYALAVRDAHGIPVVRAQVDPLRIAPETPGGKVSANQGLAVNNIPAASAVIAAPDQITLAPQVAELTPEDTQIIEGGSFAQPAGAGSDAALAGASDQVLAVPQTASGISADLTALPDALPEDMPMTDAEAVERALEAALAEGGDPMLDVAADSAPDAALAPAEPASMSATDPVAPPTAELDPTTIAVGTPMAQLGAFDTADTARAEWANLQTRFTELMAGKSLVVEPAKSGGRDFFRLRAHGFASEDDSRRFCAAILAENGSCFPVDQR